jgi:hypothetical protein
MTQEFDILEDIHRMKILAQQKGYALSSLVLLLDEDARREIKTHPEYHTYCYDGKILSLDWVLAIKSSDSKDFYYDLVVKIGAAEFVTQPELRGDQL